MAIFDFMTDGVEEVANMIGQQVTKADTLAQQLRAVTTPLENGGWIGKGAEAFFLEKNQYLRHLHETRDMMHDCQTALNQMIQMVNEAMQNINGITGG